MERIKNLNLYQKGILVLLALLFVGFTVAYSVAYNRVGFAYEGALLMPSEGDGQTVYAGKLHGREVSFIITADKTVTFRYGEKIYGPYTVREDPSAIPTDTGFASQMKGIEILKGAEVYFRGGIFISQGSRVLFPEDKSTVGGYWVSSDGVHYYDFQGKQTDPREPTATTIVNIMEGPELTRRGDWECWFYGVIASVITVVSILFADELFRWNLSFQIRDVYDAEPSEWEIFTRYAGWTVLTILTPIMYVTGLMI